MNDRYSTRASLTRLSAIVQVVVAALAVTLGLTAVSPARAQATSAGVAGTSPKQEMPHDGLHDFDFLIGDWKAHLRKRLNPLTGSTTWVEYDGTSRTRKWGDGHANLEEFEVDSPEKHLHIQGQTLRLYNPESHQWSIYLAYAAKGTLLQPPTIGEFREGRGEFYDQEDFNGRSIWVRYVWTVLSHDAARMEQSFSPDWGRTWETNWICDLTREQS